MAKETEIKLALSARAATQLRHHPLLSTLVPRRQLLVNTYYDTADRRLRGAGLVVRFRQKGVEWLLGVKTASQLSAGLAERKEWERAAAPGEFDFSHVDQGAVRELLELLRDQLQPAFVTRFQRDAWLLEWRPGVVIEVALDRGAIEAGGRRQTIREIELELVAGKPLDLFELAAALQATLPLHPEASSKADRAYRLLADQEMIPVKALPVPVGAEWSSVGAFRRIAQSCISQLQGNEKGILASDSPEFIHQARVAIRRLRSAMRVWRRHLPAPFIARFDPLWRELATCLGDARNWDVFLASTLPVLQEGLAERSESEQLLRYARRRCASSRRVARSVFRSADYSRLLLEFSAALLALPEGKARPLGDFAPSWLDRCTERVNQRAAEAQTGGDEARHRLRLAFKQLRYALDFLSPIFAGPAVVNYQQALAALQEQLGVQNDLAVAMQLAAEALPGRRADAVASWLASRGEALLPELETLLADFRDHAAPWSPQPTDR